MQQQLSSRAEPSRREQRERESKEMGFIFLCQLLLSETTSIENVCTYAHTSFIIGFGTS